MIAMNMVGLPPGMIITNRARPRPLALVQIGRHRLAQGRDAGRRRVTVMAVTQGLDRGFDDEFGGAEIRLADTEIDDVAALRAIRRGRRRRVGVLLPRRSGRRRPRLRAGSPRRPGHRVVAEHQVVAVAGQPERGRRADPRVPPVISVALPFMRSSKSSKSKPGETRQLTSRRRARARCAARCRPAPAPARSPERRRHRGRRRLRAPTGAAELEGDRALVGEPHLVGGHPVPRRGLPAGSRK